MNYTGCPHFECALLISLRSLDSATEEDCILRLRNYKLVVQKVSCEHRYERMSCILKGDKFHCPVRSYRKLMSQNGPFKHLKTKVSAKQIFIGIVSFSYSMLRTEVAKEEEVSQRTAVFQRRTIEKALPEIRQTRQRDAQSTVFFMQVDETWFSKVNSYPNCSDAGGVLSWQQAGRDSCP